MSNNVTKTQATMFVELEAKARILARVRRYVAQWRARGVDWDTITGILKDMSEQKAKKLGEEHGKQFAEVVKQVLKENKAPGS